MKITFHELQTDEAIIEAVRAIFLCINPARTVLFADGPNQGFNRQFCQRWRAAKNFFAKMRYTLWLNTYEIFKDVWLEHNASW